MVAKIKIKRNASQARMPQQVHKGDAGWDLFSLETQCLKPGERTAIKTGLALELPPGWECQLRPKSGLALHHGITLLNAPATIDQGYRGEIRVIVINHGKKEFCVKAGEKIAQMVFKKVEEVELKETENLTETTRGEKGFGSSGRK
jgi:dUTP pyrophosphatase